MKVFKVLIDETLQAENLEELEAAADLFQFGVEKEYYTKRQAAEFNTTYWKVKNRFLAYEVAKEVKGNKLDIITMVSSAPNDIKDNKSQLINYVNGRMKALKGKINGLR